MSKHDATPGVPDKDPIAAELEAYELLDQFDKKALVQAAMRKTAFAVIGYATELRESQAMIYARENMATWLGEQVTDKRNVRVALGIGGAALALITARKLLGDNWDEKISNGLKAISASVKREETTISLEQDLGALGQSRAACELFDELGSELTLAGDKPAPGALPTGVAMIRNAFSRAVFAFKEKPGEQNPNQ